MKISLWVSTLIMSVGFTGSLCAQGNRAASMEYLQSSSPLKSGGAVTSYSTPGTGVVTSFSPNTGLGVTTPATGAALPTNANQIPTENRVAANPFPAGQPSLTAPPVAFDPFTSTVPPTIQLPTLGITKSNSSYRPNLFRNLWGQQNQTLPGLPPISPPAANLAPQINPSVGSPVVAPNLQTPSSNSILLSGQNQPAIQFQNMPPGVYYGKGILGQPKAYVDGQPARNFLRFVFP